MAADVPRQGDRKYPNARDAPAWGPSEGDRERMIWLRGGLSPQMTTTSDYLATTGPERSAAGVELAQIAGYATPGGWKSALPHPAGRARRVDRRPVWEAERNSGVFRYRMLGEVRTLWLAAAR